MKQLIQEQRELIQSRDKEISEKKDLEKNLNKQIKQLEQEISRAKQDIEIHRKENANQIKERKVYEDKYVWVIKDKALFGVQHSAYDFKLRDPARGKTKINYQP